MDNEAQYNQITLENNDSGWKAVFLLDQSIAIDKNDVFFLKGIQLLSDFFVRSIGLILGNDPDIVMRIEGLVERTDNWKKPFNVTLFALQDEVGDNGFVLNSSFNCPTLFSAIQVALDSVFDTILTEYEAGSEVDEDYRTDPPPETPKKKTRRPRWFPEDLP